MKKMISVSLICALLLSGCGVLSDSAPVSTSTTLTSSEEAPPPTTGPVEMDFAKTDDEMFTDRDSRTDFDESSSTIIQLDENAVICNSASVQVVGTSVTIGSDGIYVLRGNLEDGSITVQADSGDKVQLVLDGASITNTNGAALCIEEADKAFLTLAEDTENSLSNGGSFSADENIDGTVFSRQDLTLNGTGSLTVTSPAGHGIVCKDDLVITGGTYQIQAAAHGVDANDSFRLNGATVTMDAGKDGIHVEDNEDSTTGYVYISGGQLDIESEGDGISAAVWMQIAGGTIDILAGGGHENGASHSSGGWGDFMGGGHGGMENPPPRPRAVQATSEETSTSMKGLKAAGGLLINEGHITINSADDAIHCDSMAVMNGGTIQIATGDDAIHAETKLQITGGTLAISTSYEGLEAVDVHITGGEIDMVCTDDGINAAGGTDASGTGGRDEMFDKAMGPGGMGGASNGSIVIDGGDLNIQSSGDGMDANGYLEINGGKTVICGPNSGDTATLDYETSGTINGGVFIGTGAAGMAQTFSHNTQGVLAVQVGQGQSGATITVSDKDGKELISYQPKLAFSVIIFSTPEIISGETYHITIGEVEGDMEAY